MANVLCVDDEESIGLVIEDTLSRCGHRALGARNVAEAMQVLSRERVDLIISDYRMPGPTGGGLEFLELLQREGFRIPLIMVTGDASMEHAVAAIKAGAIDCITKPISSEQLELAVQQALEVVRLRRENEALRHEVMELRNERQIIGEIAPQATAPNGANGPADGSAGVGVILQTLNVDDAERALIKRALELTRDNRTRAAQLLGISVRTLRNKLNASRATAPPPPPVPPKPPDVA